MDGFYTFWFPIFLTCISIGASTSIAFLFKHKWRPKIEDIFEENADYAINVLFKQINELDRQYDWFIKTIKEKPPNDNVSRHYSGIGKELEDKIKENVDYFEKYMLSQFLNWTLRYVFTTVTIMSLAKSYKDAQTESEKRTRWAKPVLDFIKKKHLNKKSTLKEIDTFVQRWRDSSK